MFAVAYLVSSTYLFVVLASDLVIFKLLYLNSFSYLFFPCAFCLWMSVFANFKITILQTHKDVRQVGSGEVTNAGYNTYA